MFVSRVDVFTKDLALERSFQHFSSGRIAALEEVYVKVTTDEGDFGFGEVRANSEYAGGVSRGAVLAVLESVLAPLLLGQDPSDLTAILARVDRAMVGNSAPKAAIDIALHDLLARRLGIPVYRLLGGPCAVDFTSNQSIGFASPEETERLARDFVARGYRKLKVRVGQRPFETDLARLRRVREAIGWQTSLAVDANQAWTVKEAIRCIAEMERFGIEYVEQPTPGEDLAGLRRVTESTGVPIMADESAHSLRSVFEIASTRAADLIHIKLIKSGGILNARKWMAVAEAAGMGYMMGQMNEGALATAAAIHCGAASGARYFELYGTEGILDDPTRGLEFRGGDPVLKEEPGLGMSVDESQLELAFTLRADGKGAPVDTGSAT